MPVYDSLVLLMKRQEMISILGYSDFAQLIFVAIVQLSPMCSCSYRDIQGDDM